MTEKELKQRLQNMRRVAQEARESKESARAILIKAGIVTKSGKLTKPYK